MTETMLGTNIDSKKKISIDIPRLIETRLLVEANSGGGKSYLIRKLLEESYGKVQQIVLDMEGEFATLREKYDYLLAGKDGDIPTNPKTARLLARKVLELNVSIIIDLYELKQHDRVVFVKEFIDEMINSPKELWHPVLVVLDEAHVFAPEKGESEAMSAVIDLATRGRKRGFGSVLATQRLSKLHKDVAAEMINKLIGRTSLDIDMKRAADELGMASKHDMLTLRDLEPGEFYAFGPAISKTIVKMKIGEVKTTHPKSGQRYAVSTPEPTEKVRQILQKLTDLPKEAEQELHDKESMIKRIRELERELRFRPEKIDEKKIELARQEGYIKAKNEFSKQILTLGNSFKKYKDFLLQTADRIDSLISESSTNPPTNIFPQSQKNEFVTPRVKMKESKVVYAQPKTTYPDSNLETLETGELGKCEKAILKFLAMREGKSFNKTQVGAMAQYSPTSGGFNNSLSKLRSIGLVKQSNQQLSINSDRINEVIEILGDEYMSSDKDALEGWLNKLGVCPRKIYNVLLENQTQEFTKEELGEMTGYASSSGGFNNSLSQLCTLGLAERIDGKIRFNQELLEV